MRLEVRKVEEESCPNCNSNVKFLVIKGYVISPVICDICHALLEIQVAYGAWDLILLDFVDDEQEYYESL